MSERYNKYYKDYSKKKVICDCGLEMNITSLSNHKHSDKHKLLMGMTEEFRLNYNLIKNKKKKKCECGCFINKTSFTNHLRSKKHKEHLSKK